MTNVFISYNSNERDSKIARIIHTKVKDFTDKIYFTGHYETGGSNKPLVIQEIREKLLSADIVIILASHEYIAGTWCMLELNIAMEIISRKERELSIVPIWIGERDSVDPSISALRPIIGTIDRKDDILVDLAHRLKQHDNTLEVRTTKSVEVPLKESKITGYDGFLVSEDRDYFHALLDKHEERLRNQQPTSGPRRIEDYANDDHQEQVREPSFLLYPNRSKSTYTLFIVDKSSDVDVERLRAQSTRFRLVEKERREIDLDLAGFTHSEVHPMFRVAKGKLTEVVLDANILFQALMFPLSIVKLPKAGGIKGKRWVTASSFFRSLTEFWGSSLGYAICSSRDWKDDLLFELLEQSPVHTRFAPTPSNSLHIGNIKAALIPFIFSKSRQGGSFLLRFDDTDNSKIEDEFYKTIRRDLEWFSIHPTARKDRVQSDCTDLYDRVFRILQGYGCVQALGSQFFIEEPPANHYYFWLDLQRGPIIRKGFQPNTKDGEPLNLNIRRSDGTTLYKLAGTVDDILLNSHVFRDQEQLEKGLTDRQAYVASCIRLAVDKKEIGERDSIFEDFAREAAEYINIQRRPFPLFSPIAYCHFGVINASDGSKLSKSKSATTISSIRSDGTFIPEAIVTAIVERMFPATKAWSRIQTDSFNLLCEAGLEPYYEFLGASLTIRSLNSVSQSQVISSRTIRRQERRILSRASPFLLSMLLTRVPDVKFGQMGREYFLDWLSACRKEVFSSWADVLAVLPILQHDSSIRQRFMGSEAVPLLRQLLSVAEPERQRLLSSTELEKKKELRRCLFGDAYGIRVCDLLEALDEPTFEWLKDI